MAICDQVGKHLGSNLLENDFCLPNSPGPTEPGMVVT